MNILKTEAQQSLVTVVIPAYNVEKYIKKCLNSVFEQTYSNIEVIIVNDGSTDNTKAIIESCVNSEKRAKVFNTINSGVSFARNIGIKESSGDYIIFIDGDDYISDDYVDYMLSLISETKAQFAFSTNCYLDKNEKQIDQDLIKEISSEEATTLLLSPNVTVGCWNKIYSRELLVNNNIYFEESLFYGEGLKFIIEVSQSTSKISIGNKKVYYYRKNNTSSATSKFDISKVKNGEKSLILIGDSLANQSPRVMNMFKYHLCLYRLGALVKLRLNGVHKLHNKEYQHWLSFIRSNCFDFLTSTDLNLYRKCLLICGSISPYFLSKLEVFRQNRIVKNSVDS